jgi:hypothetical protein
MAVDRVAQERDEPTKYWLSTIPEKIAFHRLVDLANLRWRIERDYQELKQQVGLARTGSKPAPRSIRRAIVISGRGSTKGTFAKLHQSI